MSAAAATGAVAVRSLSGIQKAALVLMNMSTDRAAAVLRNFDEAEALEITAEIARMRTADGRDAELAISEFRRRSAKPATASAAPSGVELAATLIHASFAPERAAGLIEKIGAPTSASTFAFLDDLPIPDILEMLQDDAPEMVAFVLVQLAPGLAAKILMQHDAGRRIDIAQCVATMGTPVPEAGGIVADVLRRRGRGGAPGGAPVAVAGVIDLPVIRVQPLVDIMNHAEPAQEGELLAGLRDRDSELADEVRAKMLSFEDLPRLADRDLQQVLRGIDVVQLALALKGAPAEIADAVRSNMSERNRQTLTEEAAEMGRVPKREVDDARNLVVRALRELAGAGGLELKKIGGDPVDADADATVVDAAPAEPEDEYVD